MNTPINAHGKTISIVGSRGATTVDIAACFTSLPCAVVSGGAKGIDQLASAFASKHNIPLVEFRPDYAAHGRGATFIRNRQIVDASEMVVAFWDGKSHGTKYTLDYAVKRGIPVKIFTV